MKSAGCQCLDGNRLYLYANVGALPLVEELRLADSYSEISR
jgi:hypothetical protein